MSTSTFAWRMIAWPAITFMVYQAAHLLHLRTTNAIESTFAAEKACTRTTKGAKSRDAGLAMVFRVVTQSERRWRRVDSPHLVAVFAAGVEFPDGKTRIILDLPFDSFPFTYKWTSLNRRSTTFDNISNCDIKITLFAMNKMSK